MRSFFFVQRIVYLSCYLEMRLNKKSWYCAHKINCPRIIGDINVLISILSLINYTPLSSAINYRCSFFIQISYVANRYQSRLLVHNATEYLCSLLEMIWKQSTFLEFNKFMIWIRIIDFMTNWWKKAIMCRKNDKGMLDKHEHCMYRLSVYSLLLWWTSYTVFHSASFSQHSFPCTRNCFKISQCRVNF